MIKDEIFTNVIDINQELIDIEKSIKNDITSIELYYYKWQIDNLTSKIDNINQSIMDFKSVQNKHSYNFYILSVLLLSSAIYFYFNNLYLFFILSIFIFTIFSIYYFLNYDNKEDIINNSLTEYIKELIKHKEKINKILQAKKVTLSQTEKSLTEDLIKDMFNQADFDLVKMIDSTNINLNYKDRDYRKFLINLYDLKMNEKDLNSYYRKILKTLLEKDLENNTRYL